MKNLQQIAQLLLIQQSWYNFLKTKVLRLVRRIDYLKYWFIIFNEIFIITIQQNKYQNKFNFFQCSENLFFSGCESSTLILEDDKEKGTIQIKCLLYFL